MTDNKIRQILKDLSIKEKIDLIHGVALFHTGAVPRHDIPEFWMSDGTMGVRMEFKKDEWRAIGGTDDYVSYLPCTSAVTSTWNRELAYKAGQVLGEEARGRGKDMILSPGINIKRNPLCGRNFEYMSEDPRVIEEMVVPYIKGIQENDVAACAKHFAANSQETARMSVDTIVDERTLNEIYFPGFKAAIHKGNLYSLMGAYNKLNGEQCCTSKKLLNDVLRDKWGFDGVVVSDWGGVHDTVEAAESALDVEMDVSSDFDNYFLAEPLLKKIEAGEISEELIDKKVENMLRLMFRLKMIGDEKEARKSGCYNTKEHQQATYEVAAESLILMKNQENILPLNPKTVGKVAVIGANANAVHADGGGSAEIKALYEITPLMGIKKLLGGNVKVSYAPGYYVPGKGARPEISWQADSTKTVDENGVQVSLISEEERAIRGEKCLTEAIELAKNSDTVIFVGGLDHDYDVEGLDRKDMKLPYNQNKVLEELLKINPNTVVVMVAGSLVEMPWLSNVKSLLWSYYAGMEGGTAIAEVLFGNVNPSGRLAETFIKNDEHCSAKKGSTFGKKDSVTYEEGVMVGYRYYDTENVDVNFCFGHGISFSSFSYRDMVVEANEADGTVNVSCVITNDGPMAGKEVVQLYVAPKSESDFVRPSHELKAFEKVSLEPGESKKVKLVIDKKDFSCYDVNEKDFVVVSGDYELQLGASSRDIRLVEKYSF